MITELADIHMIYRFPDVFPDKLQGLPSNREIKFEIELLPGTAPISKVPNRVAPAELKGLNGSCRNCWTGSLIVSAIYRREL